MPLYILPLLQSGVMRICEPSSRLARAVSPAITQLVSGGENRCPVSSSLKKACVMNQRT